MGEGTPAEAPQVTEEAVKPAYADVRGDAQGQEARGAQFPLDAANAGVADGDGSGPA